MLGRETWMAKKIWLQIFVGLGFVAALGFFVHNATSNLQARGIASGFDFLRRPAGFDIAFSLIPFGENSTFLDAFWVGLLNTLLIAVLSMICATGLGILLAAMRLSTNPLFKILSRIYLETVRNIPLLLQLFFWYFVVLRQLPSTRESWHFGPFYLNIRGLSVPFPGEPLAVLQLFLAFIFGLLIGHFAHRRAKQSRIDNGRYPLWLPLCFALPVICPLVTYVACGHHAQLSLPKLEGFNFVGGLQLIPELLAMVVALSLYTAAFIGEIIRAGILSLPKGQREAAAALGFTAFDTLFLVILPQALRVIIPPLISQYLNISKNSSLAAAIAFPDLVLVFAGTAINVTGQAVEIMAMTMAVYLVLSLSLAASLNFYQRHVLRYDS